MALIGGNTYPHRAELRAMGGDWDAGLKARRVPEAKAEARALSRRARPGAGRRHARRTGGMLMRRS
jgi:hypothetical protein